MANHCESFKIGPVKFENDGFKCDGIEYRCTHMRAGIGFLNVGVHFILRKKEE